MELTQEQCHHFIKYLDIHDYKCSQCGNDFFTAHDRFYWLVGTPPDGRSHNLILVAVECTVCYHLDLFNAKAIGIFDQE